MCKSEHKYENFKVSRSDLALFCECPRCYYNKKFLKISPPAGLPFVINNAIDRVLKDEFDNYRNTQKPHHEFINHKIENLLPYNGSEFLGYRNKGIEYHDMYSNLVLFGKLDDVWIDPETENLYIADYKATSKKELNEIHPAFKMQMDIYCFIAQKVDDRFQDKTYFFYKNFVRGKDMKLSHFETDIISYDANTSWVEKKLFELKELLIEGFAPDPSENCKNCNYHKKLQKFHFLNKKELKNDQDN